MPPIPEDPYFVLLIKSTTSICSDVFVSAIVLAIIAGSKACILTLLGLEAKLAPALINAS